MKNLMKNEEKSKKSLIFPDACAKLLPKYYNFKSIKEEKNIMDKVIEALQTILNGIGAGTSALGDVGKGTVDYGTAEVKVASGTDSFVGAFKTVFNFIAGLFNIGTVK